MFTRVTFQNLRCFKDFTLDNITPLTLISGRNNVGKTTVLEGIFLLFAYRSPDMFFKINGIRGIVPIIPSPQDVFPRMDPSSLWETLFQDMDMSKRLQISVEDHNNIVNAVYLEKDANVSFAQFPNQPNQHNVLQPVPGSYILNVVYTYGDSMEQCRFVLTQNGLALNFDPEFLLPVRNIALYIGPNVPLSQHTVSNWIGKLDLEDKKGQLVEALCLLDRDIADIFTVPRLGAVELYARRRAGKPRPVRMLGDGINKLLSYLSAMVANPGDIFLLDEIETGLHYSFYPQLWELIASVAQKTGSQVIATTHSYECIAAAVEGTSKINSSLLTYVRLGKEEGAIVPYTFAGDDLAYVLNREIEVR
jgi:ABC-type branched-subunit amino acid transport system ATPase component